MSLGSRKLALALACSLILNAFLAGYATSALTRHQWGPPPSPFERMDKALAKVDPQNAARVRAIIETHRRNFERHMRDRAADFDKIQTILTAPHFDAAALRKVHEDMAMEDPKREEILSLLIAIAQTLPDDERIAFFKDSAPERPHFAPPPPPDDPM